MHNDSHIENRQNRKKVDIAQHSAARWHL